ncbi:MAG: hypothetical protein AAGD28_13125 [Bacteroidota bacterium]
MNNFQQLEWGAIFSETHAGKYSFASDMEVARIRHGGKLFALQAESAHFQKALKRDELWIIRSVNNMADGVLIYRQAGELAGIEVQTQVQNKRACKFYEENGFDAKTIPFIYHCWL